MAKKKISYLIKVYIELEDEWLEVYKDKSKNEHILSTTLEYLKSVKAINKNFSIEPGKLIPVEIDFDKL